jgi:hypothetical protein
VTSNRSGAEPPDARHAAPMALSTGGRRGSGRVVRDDGCTIGTQAVGTGDHPRVDDDRGARTRILRPAGYGGERRCGGDGEQDATGGGILSGQSRPAQSR